jgi:sarcosine oxidase
MRYDVIVIGVGSMGSATAFELAKRGCRILGLEQFNIGHELGSASGVNRIIRLAYAEHPAYVPLLRQAYKLWRKLERVSKERLLFISGGIDAGRADGPLIQGSLKSCRQHGIPHEEWDARDLQRKFPGFHVPRSTAAVYQQDAGFVLCERAIIAHITAAQASGAEIHGREIVLGWDVTRNGVVVRTNRASYKSSRLVITAGPWAARLVPALRSRRLAQPERQVLIWTQPKRPELFRFGAFPIFILETMEGRDVSRFYGFPIHGIPGFKIGKYHHRRETVNPDRMDRECHAEDERVLRDAIRRYFPEADGPTLSMKTCLFTNSPDEHFILDRLPDCPQVSIAAGFSGHGFKFAGVIGAIMADIALEGSSDLLKGIDLFGLARKRNPLKL